MGKNSKKKLKSQPSIFCRVKTVVTKELQYLKECGLAGSVALMLTTCFAAACGLKALRSMFSTEWTTCLGIKRRNT